MNYTFRALAALSVGLALFACKKDDYVPAEQEPVQTYVGADTTVPRQIDADGSAIVVPFTRNKVADALDVTVFLDDASGIFSLDNATLHFDVGEATTYTTVSYSYDDLVPDTVYNFTVELASTEYASEYRPVALPIAATKAWKKIPALFYDDWWTGEELEKLLLKSPDGSETYRLVNPWDKETAEGAGFDYTGGLDYLEFSIDEDGAISWGGKTGIVNLPFSYSGMTTHMMHPSLQKDDAGVANNHLIEPGLAEIYYYPILDYKSGAYRWWGVASYLLIVWDAEE